MNDPTAFVRWSPPHYWAIIITLAVAAALILYARRLSQARRYLLCRILAVIVAAQFISEFTWRAFADDYGDWKNNLPLHFCGIMMIVAFIALWWRRHGACAFAYFGIMAGCIQALITPAMAHGYPSMAYYIFFIAHGLLLVVGLSIPCILGWRARGWDDLKTLLYADVYLLAVIPINLWLGTNYGYTQQSPVQGSMLDNLGAGPWYYLWLQLPVWGLFRILYLFVYDKRSDEAQAAESPAPSTEPHENERILPSS